MSENTERLHAQALQLFRKFMASRGGVEYAMYKATQQKLAKELHKEAVKHAKERP